MYDNNENISKPKLKIGDKVCISTARHVFDKTYFSNWTKALFTISELIQTTTITYKIKDYGNKQLLGSFYENKLQHVDKEDEVYKIEKIFNTRRSGVKNIASNGKINLKYSTLVDRKVMKLTQFAFYDPIPRGPCFLGHQLRGEGATVVIRIIPGEPHLRDLPM